MTFAQLRNRLTTHFSEGIPIVKRRTSVFQLLRACLNKGTLDTLNIRKQSHG